MRSGFETFRRQNVLSASFLRIKEKGSQMGIIAWIVFGLIAGFLAKFFMSSRYKETSEAGLAANLVLC